MWLAEYTCYSPVTTRSSLTYLTDVHLTTTCANARTKKSKQREQVWLKYAAYIVQCYTRVGQNATHSLHLHMCLQYHVLKSIRYLLANNAQPSKFLRNLALPQQPSLSVRQMMLETETLTWIILFSMEDGILGRD